MTTFHAPRNNSGSTVAATRSPGGPTIAVASGTPFGSTFPLLVAALRGPRASETVLCILEVTGRTGNTLTISGAVEGTTDVTISPPDRLEVRPTALAMTEIHDAVHAAESSIATLQAGVAAAGTVTTVSVVTANGVSATRTSPTTTPAFTFVLGAITPSSVNSVVLSGSSTPTLAVTGTATVSGANTGDQTNVSGNAATVTTNANLTGPITSTGNATAVASQTGTGSKFVMDTGPTLVTPNLGTPSALVGTNITGTAAGLTAGLATNGVVTTGSYADPAWITSLAKSKVGLGSVDNTADASKPVSTAQQAALDLKANLASPALTGTPTAPTAANGTNTTQVATTAFVIANATGGGGGGSLAIGDAVGDATATYLAYFGTGGTLAQSSKMAFDGTKLILTPGVGVAGISFNRPGNAQWGVGVGGEAVGNLYIGSAATLTDNWFWRANWNDTSRPANTFRSPSDAAGCVVLGALGAGGQTGHLFAAMDSGGTPLAWIAADGKYHGDGSALAGQFRASTFGAYGTIATGASKAVKFALEAQAAYWLHATCDSGSFTADIEISTDDRATWSTFETVTVTAGGTVSRSSSGAIAAGAYLRPNYTSATACDTPTVTLHARTT